jgi:hypothetical protein
MIEIMKKISIYLTLLITGLTFGSCKKYLEVQPLDKVPVEQLLLDPNGIKVLLANLYSRMPVEDFKYNPAQGFNYHRTTSQSNYVEPGFGTTYFTDEATLSQGSGVGPVGEGFWAYDAIRQTNQLAEQLPSVTTITEAQRNAIIGECRFIRAYIYFQLAKRYGGVPIIEKSLEYKPGTDNAELFIPRSTEKQTYDFILNELEEASKTMQASYSAVDGPARATKWAALSLKSRVALYAASLAKYWNRAPLVGDAVTQKLVGGMSSADADGYYQQCIDASAAVITNSGKGIFKPTPANRAEAAKNYQDMFQSPALADIEVLFKKSYVDGITTFLQGHNNDLYYNPSQTNTGGIYYGRSSPTLDLVDLYEDYTDNGQGNSARLVTRNDGNENDVVGDPRNVDVNKPFKLYDNLTDIFAGKDARLHASVILPGSKWKNTTIIMQGGLIKQDGSKVVYTNSSALGKDGLTYWSLGASSGNGSAGYSGFAGLGLSAGNNYTVSGFCQKKFTQEAVNPPGSYFASTLDFIDMRLAEVYLNYAEAAIESGKGSAALAATYINALRKRAGHVDNIPATIANILKERRVELAFEYHRYWDLVRRREMHTKFVGARRTILVPMVDLRQATPKYFFVRANNFYDETAGGRNFQQRDYYRPIPGVSTNKLVQNPEF